MAYHEPITPYCGLQFNADGRPVKVPGAPHALVTAPTRTGKTRRILAPAAVLHQGPAVLVSSKEDLAELVMTYRCVGVTAVIDLRPENTLLWPATVKPITTDPTLAIGSAEEALTVAETMLATSGVGFGAVSSSSATAAGGLWESTAARPLAALLYAASPLGNNLGMSWVLQAVENLGVDDDDRPDLFPTPSWMAAYEQCRVQMLAEPLARVLSMDPRMRDSVAITASKAVTPWVRIGLAHQPSAAGPIEPRSMDNFDVAMLDEPDATLFVLAPNTGTVAGAAVALIDSIVRHFRRKTARHQMTHRLLLELDEVCNSCPLPALLNYVGESAGLGVNILATVQASSHFDVVYGQQYATALRDIFPAALIMYGAHERHMLEQASHWSGLTTRRTGTYDSSSGAISQSSQFGSAMEWPELLPQSRDEAQLLLRGTAGVKVQIPDWSEFTAIFDEAIRARLKKRKRQRSG